MGKFESKLYRNIGDIIHPTISRKNISQYEIVIEEDLVPIRVYYPEIDNKLDKVAIYIHGDEACPDFYEEFSLKTGYIVVYIEYQKENPKQDIIAAINYIVKGLIDNGIKKENILFVGDYSGGDMILELTSEMSADYFIEAKKLLLSPRKLDLDKYEDPGILVLSNNEEQKSGEGIKYQLLKESIYDFMHDMDMVANEKVYKIILDYIKGE